MNKALVKISVINLLVAISLMVGYLIYLLNFQLPKLERSLKNQVENILLASSFSASDAVFNYDKDAAQRTIDGLLQHNFILQASIKDDLNLTLATDRQSKPIHQHWLGFAGALDEKAGYSLPLTDARMRDKHVGYLEAQVHYPTAARFFLENLDTMLVSLFVVSLLLIGASSTILKRIIFTPVHQLVEQIEQTKPDSLQQRMLIVQLGHNSLLRPLNQAVNGLLERCGQSVATSHERAQSAVDNQQDIERENKHLAEQVAELKRHIELASEIDDLTKLANRQCFIRQGNKALDLNKKEQRSIALIMVTMDSFAALNGKFSMAECDKLLQQIARWLQNRIEQPWSIGRIGGDEFAILIETTNQNELSGLGTLIHEDLLDTQFYCQQQNIHLEFSLSATVVLATDVDFEDTLNRCYLLLWEGKRDRKNQCWFG